jgi:hypothetical protein
MRKLKNEMMSSVIYKIIEDNFDLKYRNPKQKKLGGTAHTSEIPHLTYYWLRIVNNSQKVIFN